MKPFTFKDEPVCCRELKPGIDRKHHKFTDHVDPTCSFCEQKSKDIEILKQACITCMDRISATGRYTFLPEREQLTYTVLENALRETSHGYSVFDKTK